MPVLQLTASPTTRQQRRAKARRELRPVHKRATPKPRVGVGSTPVLPASKLLPEHAVLLDLYGQPPVAFHRAFVDIAGSVTAALWLSHAVAMVQQETSEDRAFSLSQDACHEATGLTRREQETARARLREVGLLTEKRRGRQLAYCLDLTELARRLLAHSADAWSLNPHGVATGTNA